VVNVGFNCSDDVTSADAVEDLVIVEVDELETLVVDVDVTVDVEVLLTVVVELETDVLDVEVEER
jgi:hypothetical protein